MSDADFVEIEPPGEPPPLDLLPAAERSVEAKPVYPELPPEEEVAIAGEGGAVHLERTLPAQLRMLYAALVPFAALWSWLVVDVAGRVTVRGLDGWVFGDASVYGTAVAIALAPWGGLVVLWVRARRDHGRCVLQGPLALLEAPLGFGRLGRRVVARADVVSWDESAVGFHLRYAGDSLLRRWLVPSFVPGWSPRRKAAARAWLRAEGEALPLPHLAERPPVTRGALLLALGALLVVALRAGFELRYDLGPPGGRYPAVGWLTTALSVCSVLAVGLVVIPRWRRRQRVAVVAGALVVGERLLRPEAIKRIALAADRLAIEVEGGRRWLLDVPATPEAAAALRVRLPRGVPLDGALPAWTQARPRRLTAGLLGLVALWIGLGNPPVYAQLHLIDNYDQQAVVVYRISDQRPAFLAVVETDALPPRAQAPGLSAAQRGLQGAVPAAFGAVLDLDQGRLRAVEGDAHVVLPNQTRLALWRPAFGGGEGQPDLRAESVRTSADALPTDLVRRILRHEGEVGETWRPWSRQWQPVYGNVAVVTNGWTVPDLLALAGDWRGTPLEPVVNGDSGVRTHRVEDSRYAMLWRARGEELHFVVILPRELLPRLTLDRHRVTLGGRTLPPVALVKVPAMGTGIDVVSVEQKPKPDALAVLTTDIRRGRPIKEATQGTFPTFWAEATR